MQNIAQANNGPQTIASQAWRMPLSMLLALSFAILALMAVPAFAEAVSDPILKDPTERTFDAHDPLDASSWDDPIPSYTVRKAPVPQSPREQVRSIADKILRSVGRQADASRTQRPTQVNFKPDPELDRMIGQLILVGFRGQSPRARDAARTIAAIRAGKVGGVLLLGHNIKSSAQLKGLTRALLNAAGNNLPPFISVDQEGGLVQRLGPKIGLRKYPSAAKVALSKSTSEAAKVYGQMARDLASHGINLNFGPVVDLKVNPSNPVIARVGRAYSKFPQEVTDFATAFIEAHNRHGVLTAAKHFPGHGSSLTDSHDGFVDISRSWSETELTPYRRLVRKGKLNMVMIGHLYHANYSSGGKHPATLSRDIVDGLLRKKLGFDGVVITDDLYMAAVRKRYSLEESFIRAIQAGNDVIMLTGVSGRSANPNRLHAILRRAVENGRISRDRIKQSYQRIVRLKRKLFAQKKN